MRPRSWLLVGLLSQPVCARPYSGRVKIADETLVQAKDRGIRYTEKLDQAIDGNASDFAAFIALQNGFDSAGAYFHFFHVYEAAEHAGDTKFAAAVRHLEPRDLDLLVTGLSEAQGWQNRGRSFQLRFPATAAALRTAGKIVRF